MCRIAGIISNRFSPDEINKRVSLMCNALKHGGPDDEGIFRDDDAKLAFGHRRLAIIDLSKNGHQPMADAKQRVWITFNGEIYNYLVLKQELLKLGAKFNSNTDTEVIINAYLHWGTAAFEKLQGMFAFALFDKEKATTYLVRDSAGIKPLYYYAADGELSFASEVRAFKAADVANTQDPAWAIRFLAFGHIPEPYTTLKNVYSLAKGSYLTWSHRENNFKIASYQQATASSSVITNIEEAKEQLRNCLSASVKSQLIADAPIGVFLSGGIDSSLITLLANQVKNQELKTISIFFNEKTYDERAYQNVVLDKVTGEKFAHLVQQREFEEFLPTILNSMDMPTTDGINSWFISKYANEDGLKAVLSGIGADELFGGYPSFNRIKYFNYLRKTPTFIAHFANYFKADKYKKLSFLEYRHYLADYLLLRGFFTPNDIAQILDVDVKQVAETLFSEPNSERSGSYTKEDASWFETNLYMQNQLLRDTDVMSMSHGLEVRVPFLSEDFLKLAASISPEIKFSNERQKKILIDSFNDILPEAVWNRPKMGFSFPLQQWMGMHTEISNEHLYKNEMTKNLIRKFKKGDMHWSKAFALYQVQLHG
ncbi:asparagine synthase (glutamine-hydrolyzing) [Mucilaginibacter sp. X4EP1]|uniref:asparagine synthase (glutamine-hydrolyzing) n=1 Tax=Mucilaginibacter sp. X4EP1 TaxID=2723092 RepID=UPI0021689705|nr:asparagine synthase (glutamine-hydrolyzing) [Mucilaginibacter sp. X4EP1]MCS3811727.1 asparagine synthase (glutamine-hydrolyzing) [Mucilaginibacter sp. X4EP1]